MDHIEESSIDMAEKFDVMYRRIRETNEMVESIDIETKEITKKLYKIEQMLEAEE